MDGAASNIAKTALLDESLDGKYAALVGGHAISTESITPATIITADKPLARTIATPAQTEPSDAARRPRSRTSGVEGWAWDGSGGGTGSDGGAHTPVTDLYAGRQRSSTHSNEMRVVSTMTTAVIQNTAIFKSNPRKELPRTLTIVQERASADNDDCDNSDAPEVAGDEPATHGGVQDSLSVTLLAPDATAINSQKLATAEQRTTAVHMRSFTNSGCTTIDGGGRGRRITAGTDYGGIARTAVDKQRQNASQHRRSRFITVDASDPSSIGARCGRHKRSGSIATFLTLPAGVDRAAHMVLRGGATRRFSLDAMRIPSRWWSLRNVIACFNVSVLVLAILVTALVSYFAGVADTRNAVEALSRLTMNDAALKMDGVLGHAEDINLFTRTSFSSSDLGIWNSVLGVRQLYYLMVEFQANIERVHVVRNDGIFVSVAADRQPQLDIGSSHSPAFQVSYLNRTTRPYALTYAVDGGCSLNDTTCVFQAFLPESVPLARTTVDIRASPFFQQALQRQQSGWTSVYLSTQATNITRPKLMVTAIQPVWIRNTFLFVGAVEISLDSLSNYLSRLASLVSASGAVSAKDASVDDAATRPLMLVLEARTGLMVASSSTDQVAVTSPTGNRLSIVESSSVQVKRFLESIRLEFGGLDQIPWSSMENPIIVDDGASLAVASPYTRSGGDIDWILITFLQPSTFNRELRASGYIQVPIAAAAVLLVAIVISVATTRTIGRPLKHLARDMLSIADLDFQREGSVRDDVRNGSRRKSQMIAGDDGDDDSIHARMWSPFTYILSYIRWLMSIAGISVARRASSAIVNCDDNDESDEEDSVAFKIKELHHLRSAMKAMKNGLKSFAKYVPLDVVTLLMKLKREAVLGVDEMDLTIFFSDIANFTTIAESIPPQQLVEMISEYLSNVSDIIQQSEGVVDKYIGDAVMAFWNAPLPVRDHPMAACTAALKIRQRLVDIRKDWSQKGYPEIRTRIGINTGLALVGNLGSTSRLSYTCLGDNVNLASRLEGLNKRYGTEIIVSDATKLRLDPEYFVTRPLDVVAVKGKTRAVRVHELVGFRKLIAAERLSAYSIYDRAFEEYVRGNFQAAAEGFNVCAKAFGDKDTVTLMHRDRCLRLAANPPTEDWNCTVHIEDK